MTQTPVEHLEARERDLLGRLQEVRDTLALLKGEAGEPQPARPRVISTRASRGKVSQRQAILDALKDAGGAVLHVRDIKARAEEKGASFGGADPENQVDLLLYKEARTKTTPIEKVQDGSKSWRWTN